MFHVFTSRIWQKCFMFIYESFIMGISIECSGMKGYKKIEKDIRSRIWQKTFHVLKFTRSRIWQKCFMFYM
ncbi:hypothetical protein BHU24_07995 [Bacillus pseudomycoides]|nr:hypothetical protein [Bacillus pseudomycoides]